LGENDKESLTGSPPKTHIVDVESSHGLLVPSREETYTPLELSSEGALKPIQISKEEANRLDKYGRPPLCRTIQQGNEADTIALLAAGADPHWEHAESGNTLLHEATSSRNPSPKIVTLLAEEYKLDPNTLNRNGLAPLHYAARCGKIELFRALVQLPSTLLDMKSQEIDKPNKNKAKKRQTALHILAESRSPHAPEMAEIILKPNDGRVPADPTITDVYDKTPLEIAAAGSHKTAMPILLQLMKPEDILDIYQRSKNPDVKKTLHAIIYKSSPNSSSSSSSSSTCNNSEEIQYVHTSELFKDC